MGYMVEAVDCSGYLFTVVINSNTTIAVSTDWRAIIGKY